MVGGGDADDQVKLVLVGENDCVVDIEISTILTIYANLYEIWGSRGSFRRMVRPSGSGISIPPFTSAGWMECGKISLLCMEIRMKN